MDNLEYVFGGSMQNNRIRSIEEQVIKALSAIVPDRVSETSPIDSDQDLLEFVDSFGFVQLLMSIEAPLGIELDLTTTDLGSIVRFNDLVAFLSRSAAFNLADAG